MPKEEWGTKRVCPATGKRFYDLNKDPIVSPYTGEVVSLDTGKGKRSLTAEKSDAASAKKEDDKSLEEDDLVLDDDDDDTDVDLGDDVLDDEDDNDDVSLDEIADVATDDDN